MRRLRLVEIGSEWLLSGWLLGRLCDDAGVDLSGGRRLVDVQVGRVVLRDVVCGWQRWVESGRLQLGCGNQRRRLLLLLLSWLLRLLCRRRCCRVTARR